MSQNSIFDPQALLDSTTEESMSTTVVPCPEGEYPATIKEVKLRQWQSAKDPSLAGLAADIFWTVDDQQVLQLLERKEVIVKQGIMLDMTEQGGLDCSKGKNVGLGKLREAVNLNVPGRPFSLKIRRFPPRKAPVPRVIRPARHTSLPRLPCRPSWRRNTNRPWRPFLPRRSTGRSKSARKKSPIGPRWMRSWF